MSRVYGGMVTITCSIPTFVSPSILASNQPMQHTHPVIPASYLIGLRGMRRVLLNEAPIRYNLTRRDKGSEDLGEFREICVKSHSKK